MRYVSTRGQAPDLDFAEVTLTGLASDGGLYVPERWPELKPDTLVGLQGRPYHEVASRVMEPYLGTAIERGAFAEIVEQTYAGFDDQAVAPLRHMRSGEWLLELFHGPTLAFKDIALQLLGRLFDYLLAERRARATIVGATSGDTGSAAIEACRDRDSMEIFMLHPAGRVSEVQRRQMTTVLSTNVHNIAIEGTFDDCQALLKALFGDPVLREELQLSAVNSINWARVMAQTVYYVYGALTLGAPARTVSFAVPTGNFGDVYAGYVARAMGLPINRLIVANNRNDILHRFFEDGRYRIENVHPTMSPSMDIQVASNFERLLFDLEDRDAARVAEHMAALAEQGEFSVEPDAIERARAIFESSRTEEEETLATIASVWADAQVLVDPHTAVAIHAGRACNTDQSTPLVVLATAHPAKFPDAVEAATGVRPKLPDRLKDLLDREERYDTLPNDLETLKDHLRSHAS